MARQSQPPRCKLLDLLSQVPLSLPELIAPHQVLRKELVQIHVRRVPERRALRPALRAARGVVRREHVLAHELERDDLARLEDDVLLRRRRGRAREAELGREARDEVVRVLRAPHVDPHDGEVMCVVEGRFAEVLGAQAVAEVEQAAVIQTGMSLEVREILWDEGTWASLVQHPPVVPLEGTTRRLGLSCCTVLNACCKCRTRLY